MMYRVLVDGEQMGAWDNIVEACLFWEVLPYLLDEKNAGDGYFASIVAPDNQTVKWTLIHEPARDDDNDDNILYLN